MMDSYNEIGEISEIMDGCLHTGNAEHLAGAVESIQGQLAACRAQGKVLTCANCRATETLFVCCACGTMLCADHAGVQSRTRHTAGPATASNRQAESFAAAPHISKLRTDRPAGSGEPAKTETGDAHYGRPQPCQHVVLFDTVFARVYCVLCQAYPAVPSSRRNTIDVFNTFDTFVLKRFTNHGHVTHISAMLQVLLNTASIRDYFFSFHHPRASCQIANCPNCFFKELFSQLYTVDPLNMGNAMYFLAQRIPHILDEVQGDSTELFSVLANMFHTPGSEARGCACIMHKVFFSLLETTVSCAACQHVSVRRDDMSHLELRCTQSLSEALAFYFSAQYAKTSNPCPSCRTIGVVRTEARMVSFPPILCLFFRRFPGGLSQRKITCKIHVDLEILVEGHQYKVCAFIEHKGIHRSTHIAYILLNDEWYEFTDEKIIRDMDGALRIANASVLFYRRN